MAEHASGAPARGLDVSYPPRSGRIQPGRLHGRGACALAVAATLAVAGSAPPRQAGAPGAPQIEAHAGPYFGPDAGERSPETVATYRVDAQVLLPLLLVSIPIASRSRVGFGHFFTAERVNADGTRLRALEFFATSIPSRARGLNRLGFLREAVQTDGGGAVWTAYYGVVSSTREETREQAEAALDKAEGAQRFSVVDGMITRGEANNAVSYVELVGLWDDASELYAEIRRRLAGRPADRTRSLANPSRNAYAQPLAFLGGLQASLLRAARTVAAGGDPRGQQQPYVHDGRVLRFELTGNDVDTGRGRDYVRAGWASSATAVYRLEYRVLAPDGDRIEKFTLWAELPRGAALAAPRPIVPISFELQPRAFLRLRAERVKPGSTG